MDLKDRDYERLKMYKLEKKCMKAISQYAGQRVDYVQGGGGNTSYKFDDKIMAIKASGYSLAEVEEENGYVTVNYSQIKDRYADISKKTNIDVEKETLNVNLQSISLLDNMENKRPSVEVGFHSYLPRAVVHTHSVYSNLICCCEEGYEIAEKIFHDSNLSYIFIPFINPGFKLSMHIKKETEDFKAKRGKMPDLIFMESHGVIASNDDFKLAMNIHEKANRLIADYFHTVDFPIANLESTDKGFKSHTQFIKDFILEFNADEKYFNNNILYPDQMVYLSDNLGKTIQIDKKNGIITYEENKKKAIIHEEVILGVAYIISEITRIGLTQKWLCNEGIEFIRNWESEKYRASLA